MRNTHIPTRIATLADLKPGLQLVAHDDDCTYNRIVLERRHSWVDGWWFKDADGKLYNAWVQTSTLLAGRYRIPLDFIKVMEFECATFTRNADGDIPIRFEGMETTTTVALTTAQAKELVGKLQAAIDADPDEALKREMRALFPQTLEAGKQLVVTKQFTDGGRAYTYTIMWDSLERRLKHTSQLWPRKLTYSEVIERLIEGARSLDVTVLTYR